MTVVTETVNERSRWSVKCEKRKTATEMETEHFCQCSVPVRGVLDTVSYLVPPGVTHRAQRGDALSGHAGREGNLYRVAQAVSAWLSGTVEM